MSGRAAPGWPSGGLRGRLHIAAQVCLACTWELCGVGPPFGRSVTRCPCGLHASSMYGRHLAARRDLDWTNDAFAVLIANGHALLVEEQVHGPAISSENGVAVSINEVLPDGPPLVERPAGRIGEHDRSPAPTCPRVMTGRRLDSSTLGRKGSRSGQGPSSRGGHAAGKAPSPASLRAMVRCRTSLASTPRRATMAVSGQRSHFSVRATNTCSLDTSSSCSSTAFSLAASRRS